jgi:hypothetical protein
MSAYSLLAKSQLCRELARLSPLVLMEPPDKDTSNHTPFEFMNLRESDPWVLR